MTALEKVINKYNCHGFTIIEFHGNNEFDKALLNQFLEPALMHMYSREEHVDPIE